MRLFLYRIFTLKCIAIPDRYTDRLAKLFEYEVDKPECCAEKAQPDEFVYHLRNFKNEMTKKFATLGFEDLSPHQLAYEAFGHLKEGDRLSFTARGGIESVRPFMEAFEERKIRVRVVKNRNDLQDFCYLLSAQRELMVYTVSTYGAWAAWLGNASRVRMYTIQSAQRMRAWGDDWKLNYNFTNPVLRGRVQFEVYKTAEYMEQEKKEKGMLETAQ